MSKLHLQAGRRQGRKNRVGPLHERDRTVTDRGSQKLRVLIVGPLQAIRIDMRHLDIALVALGHGEGRARDRPAHAECPRNGTNQGGLAGSQLAAQEHQITRMQHFGQGLPEGRGVLGPLALPDDRLLGQNNPSCGSPAGAVAGAVAGGGGAACSGSAFDAGRLWAGTPSNSGIRAKSASSVASIDRV